MFAPWRSQNPLRIHGSLITGKSFIVPSVLHCHCLWAVCCLCTKSRYNCRKDEELVRLLRSYDKQISINVMKKIGAPLLGLAKYIYIIKQIDSKFPCVCSEIDHRRRQNCGKNISDTVACGSCATFLFLPHFDVICDLLLNNVNVFTDNSFF